MYTLWVFGQVLESMLGRARFLLLFLISGLGGSVAVMYLGAPQTGVVGASGAIFGLLGAFLVIQRRLGGDSTQLLVLVGINLVIGFLPGMSISWQAHVGGLVTGLVLGLIFMSTRRPQQQQRQWLLIGLTALALIVLVVSRSPLLIG
jgi:membrane associated rhomboid family serine protease